MAVVRARHDLGESFHALAPRSRLGRAPDCEVVVAHARVSAVHLGISWARGAWVARDLGSTNGTRIDDRLIEPRERVTLRVGTVLSLGGPASIEVLDIGPPGPAARGEDGALVTGSGGLLEIPGVGEALEPVSLTESVRRGWTLERIDGVSTRVRDSDVVCLGGRSWTLLLPREETGALPSTFSEPVGPLSLAEVVLCFEPSLDEEHVALVLSRSTGQQVRVSGRFANYLLLVLARARLEDREQRIPERDQGWIDSAELARMLAVAPERLNIEVFRARRALSAVGMIDAARIVERRPTSRQLRIGTGRIELGDRASRQEGVLAAG